MFKDSIAAWHRLVLLPPDFHILLACINYRLLGAYIAATRTSKAEL
jgi:hypothetical protein